MEEKFGLYIVDGEIDTPNEDDYGFDWIFDNAVDSYKSNELPELLNTLVDGLNKDRISDTHWFFILDLENGILLSDTPFNLN